MPLLVEKIIPGATTCIVVGGLAEPRNWRWESYQSVLWWTDVESARHAPLDLPRNRLRIASVETTSSRAATDMIEAFTRLNPRRLPCVFVTDAMPAARGSDYNRVLSLIHSLLAGVQQSRATRQLDGFRWQKHILSNADAYTRRRIPSTWSNALRGTPAFVCGAGPSLETSVRHVAANALHGTVFAADSALRTLARHGVTADFAVSIDAAKVPEKCLPPDHLPSRVILSSVSPPLWLSAVPPETLFFVSGRQITDDWLATLGAPRTSVCASDNCGSTAIDLAIDFGCDPIFLCGLDLAVDQANQGQTHSRDADPSAYKGFNYDKPSHFPSVPGNYTESVPCFAFSHWEALDQRLAGLSHPKIYNLTDRGARLRGTTLVHPDRFVFPADLPEKSHRLGALATARSEVSSPPNVVLAPIGMAGQRAAQQLPRMQQALTQGGPAAVAQLLRAVLLDEALGRLLGAFSLKVMPHLMPPIEGDTAFWQTLLDEFAELTALAERCGSTK